MKFPDSFKFNPEDGVMKFPSQEDDRPWLNPKWDGEGISYSSHDYGTSEGAQKILDSLTDEQKKEIRDAYADCTFSTAPDVPQQEPVTSDEIIATLEAAMAEFGPGVAARARAEKLLSPSYMLPSHMVEMPKRDEGPTIRCEFPMEVKHPQMFVGISDYPNDRDRLYLFIKDHNLKPHIAARVRRLNPKGLRQGSMIRGMRPRAPDMRNEAFMRGCVTVREFIAVHGSAEYRKIPRSAIFRQGHRKLITRQYAEGLR